MDSRDSLIFYRSFYEAIRELPKDNQAEVYDAIFLYALDFTEPILSGLSKTIFILIKPQLNANIAKYKNGKIPKQKGSKEEANTKQEETKTEGNGNDNETVKENNNVNKPALLGKEPKASVDWDALIKQFNEITGKATKVINAKVRKQILTRLDEGYSKRDFIDAITNCYNDDFHIANGHKHLTLEFISRPDKLDKFVSQKDFKPTKVKEERL